MNTLDRVAVVIALLLVLVLGIYVLVRAMEDPGRDRPATIERAKRQRPTGSELFRDHGCNACHTTDGRRGLGPSLKGLYGSKRSFRNGSRLVATESYLRESIRYPDRRVVDGFRMNMPSYDHLSTEKIDRLISFIKSLSSKKKAETRSHEPKADGS